MNGLSSLAAHELEKLRTLLGSTRKVLAAIQQRPRCAFLWAQSIAVVSSGLLIRIVDLCESPRRGLAEEVWTSPSGWAAVAKIVVKKLNKILGVAAGVLLLLQLQDSDGAATVFWWAGSPMARPEAPNLVCTKSEGPR